MQTAEARRHSAIRSVLADPAATGTPGAARFLLTREGKRIGGSYRPPAARGEKLDPRPWMSWGIAGESRVHSTRAEAEAVQIEKWNAGPTHLAVVNNMLSKAVRVLESYRNDDRSWQTEEQVQASIIRQEAWLAELEDRRAMLTGPSFGQQQ